MKNNYKAFRYYLLVLTSLIVLNSTVKAQCTTLVWSDEFNKDGAPHGHPCIRLDAAIGLVAERLTCDAKRRTERAQQALTALVARGIYGLKEDWLWRI